MNKVSEPVVRSGWAVIPVEPTMSVDELLKKVRARHDKGRDVYFEYTMALPAGLMEAMAAVIDAAPETAVRIYSRKDVAPGFDWLDGLEKLRHLSVECARATTFESLERFADLRSLFLGSTTSKRPSLSLLASLPQLTRLRVDGHVKGAEAIAELKHLRYLQVSGARDEQWLVRVGPHPALEQLVIGLGSIRNLRTLPNCPRLRYLHMVRVAGLTHEHLRPIENCQNLEKLSLFQLKNVSRLPDFSGPLAGTLRDVVLSSLQNLDTVRELLALQRLTKLQLTDTVPHDQRIRDLRNVDDLNLVLDDRYPDAEIRALLDGYKGETLLYRGEWLIGTQEQRVATSRALKNALNSGPLS